MLHCFYCGNDSKICRYYSCAKQFCSIQCAESYRRTLHQRFHSNVIANVVNASKHAPPKVKTTLSPSRNRRLEFEIYPK
jgi:hypothetical protein